MTNGTASVMLATAFTAGCMAIHELRGRAGELTPPLALIAACLCLFVGLFALAEHPGAIDRETALRATAGGFAEPELSTPAPRAAPQ